MMKFLLQRILEQVKYQTMDLVYVWNLAQIGTELEDGKKNREDSKI